MPLGTDSITITTSALMSQLTQRGTVANAALARGAQRLQEQNYGEALREFQIAMAYQPDLPETHLYIGRTYEMQGRTEDAIRAYKTAIRLDPSRTDSVEWLASLYLLNERYPEAEQQLKQLIRLDPFASGPVASLGYAYQNSGRPTEAEPQFQKAIRLEPHNPSGYFSLGALYNQQGRFREAIDTLEQAIQLDPKHARARAELAYAHLGLDEYDPARLQLDELRRLDTGESRALADDLAGALRMPRILFHGIMDSTFNLRLGPGTPLDELDASLATPGATKTLQLILQFNRAMDLRSVQDLSHWSITRASGGPGGVYNYGVTLHPENEIAIAPQPRLVRYDPKTYQAFVYFTVRQNATGTGIMDPSHWEFRFMGRDAEGRAMDPRGDQYDGQALQGY